MEQGSRLDSTPAPVSQDADRNTEVLRERDDAIARLLTDPGAVLTALPLPVAITPAEACPAYRIGLQIGRKVRKHQFLDTPGAPDPDKARQRAMDRADDEMDLLFDAISYALPTSIPGALAQIVTGTRFMRETMQRSDLDEAQIEGILRAAQRCFYGAAGVLSAHTGMSPDLFGADYVMPRHLDFMRRALDGDDEGTHSVPNIRGEQVGPQIPALAARYRSERDLYDRASRAEDEAQEAGDKVAAAKANTCVAHAIRMMHTTLRLMASVPAVSLDDFAHKARVIAHEVSEWWDTDKIDHGEVACRHMLDQLMAAGGLTRWPVRDFTPEELARSFLGSPSTGGAA